MRLTSQRRIAARLLKVGQNKIVFDPSKLPEIKEAITKADIRFLISEGAVKARPFKNTSRGRARKLKAQKRKGRRKGLGSRKGKKFSRVSSKRVWINKVRAQRKFVKMLKEKKLIQRKIYRDLYRKIKGNFFRTIRHIKLYIEEHKLIKK